MASPAGTRKKRQMEGGQAEKGVFRPSVRGKGKDDWIGWGGEEDDALMCYFREMGELTLLTEYEEQELSARVQQGDTSASLRLVEANLRLVVSIALKHVGRGMSLEDLVQEGNLGLMRAAKDYDSSQCRFGTYAYWWVHQAITRALEERGSCIHIPAYAHKELRVLYRARNRLLHEQGYEPDLEELAAATGLEVARLEVLQRALPPISLEERTYGEGEEVALMDLLPDPEVSVEGAVERAAIHALLLETMRTTLTTREQQVIRLRYGLEDGMFQSCGAIGHELGITRERVRQIEVAGLQKLRQVHLLHELL